MKSISNKKKGIIKFRIKKQNAELSKKFKEHIRWIKEAKDEDLYFIDISDIDVECVDFNIGKEKFITL